MKADVIIIGAGAAGLMCAIEASKRGRKVLVLESSDKVGKKILISGGGRCNFTNLHIDPEAYLSHNSHFCKSALARYTQWDFIALMDKYKLGWHEKTLGQLFCDDKAPAVLNMLLEQCKRVGIKVESKVESIDFKGQYIVVADGQKYQSESLVIATGGPSIPKMGATDFGLQVARQFGIKT
ncbi:MAG TPA: aminoacetone oxidase family FAD-binding enzyme, partial [Gammaproteobacteria bacterium]|nr:aminoacetone oxidase family FAD-binding enzyme [Gammaproteobacteria bacterium]